LTFAITEPRGLRGLVPGYAMGAIRFSIGRYTTRGRKRTAMVGKTPQVFDFVRNIILAHSVNA
jgi:hypothetical protein